MALFKSYWMPENNVNLKKLSWDEKFIIFNEWGEKLKILHYIKRLINYYEKAGHTSLMHPDLCWPGSTCPHCACSNLQCPTSCACNGWWDEQASRFLGLADGSGLRPRLGFPWLGVLAHPQQEAGASNGDRCEEEPFSWILGPIL